jgi:2-methylcitrate dehydratase PrpD
MAQGDRGERRENPMSAGARDAIAAGIGHLADWATATPAAAIPREVMARAVRVLADDLSAIVGARDEPEVAAFHDRILCRDSAREATVYRGGRTRTDRIQAAVANALAADWLELDEGYRPTPCHAACT